MARLLQVAVARSSTTALRDRYEPATVLDLLEFRILGPLEVVEEGRPLRLGGPKQRAVLAILLLHANRVVPIDRLAEDLYGDAAPASALTQIQAQISHLRKLLGASDSPIETRAPGYLLRLEPEQLDLRRFERWAEDAAEAHSGGDAATAARRYREALDLWRGLPLAEFAQEPFAQPAIARLEDLRLGVLEERIDTELAIGRQPGLVSELEELVVEHPLRERMHGQLMLALYGSQRQAEALEVYRRLRRQLVDELGIEPSPALQELERAILAQDSSLEISRSPGGVPVSERSILVVASTGDRFEALLTVAEPLAARAGKELILARPVPDDRDLGAAAAATNAHRHKLGVPARAAAFTTSERAVDVIRLTESYDVALVLLGVEEGLEDERLPEELTAVLERSPCDVAILAGSGVNLGSDSAVVVPFGGGEHDWAALELAAWLAAAAGSPLRLLGTRARQDRRDASRLLADAAIAVQGLVDVDTEPLLADPNHDAITDAVAGASALVVGISPRWRREGIGASRRALLGAGSAVLLVHHGLRPGGLSPTASRSRFTWSLRT